jgi:hypothetical protein
MTSEVTAGATQGAPLGGSMHTKFTRRTPCATIVAAVPGLAYASPALAAQSIQTVVCTNGSTYQVSTNSNHSSMNGGWGTAQVVELVRGTSLTTSG